MQVIWNVENVLMFVKVLHLKCLKGDSVADDQELAYVQLMEATDQVFGADRACKLVHSRWPIEEEVKRMLDISESLSRNQVETAENMVLFHSS